MVMRWLKAAWAGVVESTAAEVLRLRAQLTDTEDDLEEEREALYAERRRRENLETAAAELRRAFECATDRTELHEADFVAKWGDADEDVLLDKALAAFDVQTTSWPFAVRGAGGAEA